MEKPCKTFQLHYFFTKKYVNCIFLKKTHSLTQKASDAQYFAKYNMWHKFDSNLLHCLTLYVVCM